MRRVSGSGKRSGCPPRCRTCPCSGPWRLERHLTGGGPVAWDRIPFARVTKRNGPTMTELTVSADPTNPAATLRAVATVMRMRDYPAAERLLGWALDFNPEHGGLLRRMSEVRADQGDEDGALSWAEQALAADGRDAENYAHLATQLARHGRFAEGETALESAAEMRPESAHYLRR